MVSSIIAPLRLLEANSTSPYELLASGCEPDWVSRYSGTIIQNKFRQCNNVKGKISQGLLLGIFIQMELGLIDQRSCTSLGAFLCVQVVGKAAC
jgi:hypothetical protein